MWPSNHIEKPVKEGYTWACDLPPEQPTDGFTCYNRDCEKCFIRWRTMAENPKNTFGFGTKSKLYSLHPGKHTESEIREWYFARGAVQLKEKVE